MDSSMTEVSINAPMAFKDGSYGCLVLDRLGIQRELKNFCDVILHADDHDFPAHRNVLAASSPYLESSLTRNNQSTEHLVVNCGNHRIFEAVLNYMYSGKITIDKESVTEVLRLANFLAVAKLKEHCAEYLQQGLTTSSCFHIRDLADSNGLSVLSKTVEAFIFAHVLEIINHDDVLELSESKLDFLISRSMPLTEIQRVTLICRWLEHRVGERRTRLPTLLAHILWERVGALELCHFLQETALLADCEFSMYHVLQSLKDSCLLPDIYFESLNTLRSKFASPSNSDSSVEALTPTDNRDDEGDQVVTGQLDKDWDDVSVKSESTIIMDQSETCQLSIPSPERETLHSTDNDEKQDTAMPASPSRSEIPSRSKRKRVSKKLVQIQDEELQAEKADSKDQTAPEILRKTRKRLRENDENAANTDDAVVNNRGKKPKKSSPAKISRSNDTTEEVVTVEKKRRRQRNSCPRLSCDHCPFTTLYSEKLEIHLKAAHRDDSRFHCTVCSFACKWNREFYQHMKSHFPGPPHLCDRCGFSAERVQVLLVHQMDHTDERPYECKTCGMKFKMKNNLVVHARCHSGEKPFPCPDCDRSFATKGTLEQHAVTHSNQRPYLCDLCGFSTKFQSHLIAHKRLHTGDVFKCQFTNCDYSTPKRSQLACHMRCHMRIRSHTCSTCGKSFVEKSHLVRHERVHLDDKPFKCDLCDYGSTRRDKLKEHQAKYHDDSSTSRMAYHPRKSKQLDSSSNPIGSTPAKPEKSTKSGKLPKPAKSAKKIIATVKRTSDGGSAPSDVAEAGNCDARVGVLIDTSVASDQQNICTYAQTGILPLQVNTYAALGLVPLQTNGLAAIQINAITPVQANLVPHDLLNIAPNGQVNGFGNFNTFMNGQIIGLGSVFCGGQVDLVSNSTSNAAVVSTSQVSGFGNGNSPNAPTISLNGQGNVYSSGQLIDLGSGHSNGHLNVITTGQASVSGVQRSNGGQMDDVSPVFSGIPNGTFQANGHSNGHAISIGNGALNSNVAHGNDLVNGNGRLIPNGNAISNGNGSVDSHADDFSSVNGNGVAVVPLNIGAGPAQLNGAVNRGNPVDGTIDSGNAGSSLMP